MPVALSVDYCFFFFYCSGDHRDLHSFPTRRSSDLAGQSVVIGRSQRHASARMQVTSRQSVTLTRDRKSTRLNSSHLGISYAVFCLKKKKNPTTPRRESSTRT